MRPGRAPTYGHGDWALVGRNRGRRASRASGEQVLDEPEPSARELSASRHVTTTLLPASAIPASVEFAVEVDSANPRDGSVRVRIVGELDAWSAPALAQSLAGLSGDLARLIPARPGRAVLVDLSGLTFLDSGGLTGLTEARAALLAAGWQVTLGRTQPQVRRMLEHAARLRWLPDGFWRRNDG